MDPTLGCFTLIALAALLVPFIMSIAFARRVKALELTLQKLSARISALEGGVAPPIPQTSPRPVVPSVGTIVEPVAPAAVPPPLPKAPAPKRVGPAIDWEAFMGVKLFAWIGGFGLFLGVVFLVKYSFENNLITPAMRIVLGAIIGLALVSAGWWTSRRRYRVPGQSLCATGVLVLYADVFGAHTFYGLVSLGAAFALMSAITIGAFLLAVKMNAPVVVVLGLVGGFSTPPLLTSGDHPGPIFGYIALLNCGIAAVALRKRWDYLFLLAALGTVSIEFLWIPIHDTGRITLGFPIFLGLEAQFLVIAWLRQRLQPHEMWSTPAAAIVGFAALGFAFVLLGFESLAMRPGFFFSFTFLADVGLLTLATARPNPLRIAGPAGSAMFVVLSIWTATYLTLPLLWWALGAYLLFALVHAGFGVFSSSALKLPSPRAGRAMEVRRNLPALATAAPFVLLLMLIAKLPVPQPTAVFAFALLMAIVLLAFGIVSRTSWIAAVALAFSWAVEREWHSLHFSNGSAPLALGWYAVFALVFIAYPFFTSEGKALPWAVGALSGVLHFTLIYELVLAAYPNLKNGLLPAAFILPYAFGVYYLITKRRIAPASGDARLAWQGGAALLFVSLIFPVQFEREWITLGWALEGFALLFLFRVVPNGGLRFVGAALLSTSFVRLALNPAVLEYHRRTPLRIWNWYLYAYGLTSLCLCAGARISQAKSDTPVARVIPRLLYTLGAVLIFLLLNIEIADYFSVGPTLTFSFSGNFARDMTYSIAWALFALALLLIGMKGKLRYVRYAGLALLIVTLLKLFLHDLSSLSQLYRIGAFIGVALILIVASFIYQRFVSANEKTNG